ncbi:MAG: 50S ribosomal protein L33 [Planctomycetota bacterium]
MRDSITLTCTECSHKNYRTTRMARAENRLELKKFCRSCRKHTMHKEQKK